MTPDRKTGLSSACALVKASSPQGYQSTFNHALSLSPSFSHSNLGPYQLNLRKGHCPDDFCKAWALSKIFLFSVQVQIPGKSRHASFANQNCVQMMMMMIQLLGNLVNAVASGIITRDQKFSGFVGFDLWDPKQKGNWIDPSLLEGFGFQDHIREVGKVRLLTTTPSDQQQPIPTKLCMSFDRLAVNCKSIINLVSH